MGERAEGTRLERWAAAMGRRGPHRAEMERLAATIFKMPRVPGNWRLNGSPISNDNARTLFSVLDWSKAWLDWGPSIAGNPGPYWHVPVNDTPAAGDWEGTVHRLYPRGSLAAKARRMRVKEIEAAMRDLGPQG